MLFFDINLDEQFRQPEIKAQGIKKILYDWIENSIWRDEFSVRVFCLKIILFSFGLLQDHETHNARIF